MSSSTSRAPVNAGTARSSSCQSIGVRRIYDKKNDTLVYVAYSRQVKDASKRMGAAL